MLIRNADGTVDHDGEYDPFEEMDRELADKCRSSGGFVFRTGTVVLGRHSPKLENGVLSFVRLAPDRHIGDGLHYVLMESANGT